MTFEDPFFAVKEGVSNALNKTRSLYQRWEELQAEPVTVNQQVENEWTTTDLRNSLRSIEWELEDLEDTISIIEKNPSKFKLDKQELSFRRSFIEHTRQEVKPMREKLNYSRGLDKDKTAKQPLLDNLTVGRMNASTHSSTKYSKLENQVDSPEHTQFVRNALTQQTEMLHDQDDQLDEISDSLGTLKTMSHHIGSELEEQAGMLDELANELGQTESRIDYTVKKVAKVLHLSNDRSQWIAIGIMCAVLLVILVLFIIL